MFSPIFIELMSHVTKEMSVVNTIPLVKFLAVYVRFQFLTSISVVKDTDNKTGHWKNVLQN